MTTDGNSSTRAQVSAMLTDEVRSALEELAPVGAPARGDEVQELRSRLIGLITGTGPGIQLQPIMHIQSSTQIGAEALARFPGSMPTSEWFRTADALGVSDDLELRILHEVVQRIGDRHNGFIGVNLSPRVLLDPRAIAALRSARDAELMVEITDQNVMPKMTVLRSRLDDLRNLGVRVAIHVSEFGVETMQLLMLARPDVIKLDPPMTAALAAGRIHSTVATNVFTYCRQEGVFVIAVGVESQDQLAPLLDAGVDAFQGFFLAPPR